MHNTGQKAQHRTQTKGNDTQGALQRPRGREGEKFGLCQQHSARDSNRQDGGGTSHRPEGNTKKSHRSLRPEQSGSVATANGTAF